MVLDRVLTNAARNLDRAFYRVVLQRKPRGHAGMPVEKMNSLERVERLARIEQDYETARYAGELDGFFPAGGVREMRETLVRELPSGGRVLDLSWRSSADTHRPEIADQMRLVRNSRLGAARWLQAGKGEGRPVVVQVHGYLGGVHAIEERIMPVQFFLDRGVDVVLAVLPFHGPRADDPVRDPRKFFSGDPRITIEALRQGVIDLRDLSAWLRARGATHVGALGMSLGGYTSSLLGTVDPTLDFLVPLVPLASIPEIARAGRSYVGDDDGVQAQYDAHDRVLAPVSPLARAPMVKPERVVVLGATHDAITPIDHSKKLAAHYKSPLVTFEGGHLYQRGRESALRAAERVLLAAGAPFEPAATRRRG